MTTRYVAIHADWECCGFTSKENFDRWTDVSRKAFIDGACGMVEFDGPDYPRDSARAAAVFAEVKQLAAEAVEHAKRNH